MNTYRILHNPRCSKSRAALQLLEEHGIQPEVIRYLDTPPSRAELAEILKLLGKPASELVRRGEEIFKNEYAGRKLSEDEWLEALLKHPVLIERPIIIAGQRAVIGRPPEAVLQLLED